MVEMHENWKRINENAKDFGSLLGGQFICHQCGKETIVPRLLDPFDRTWKCSGCGAEKRTGSGGGTIYYDSEHVIMRKQGGIYGR